MKWKKFTIDTTTAATDFISNMLSECGVEGIEIQDNVPLTEEELKQMFVDIPAVPSQDDGSAKISFYLDYEMPEAEAAELIEQVQEGLREVALFVEAGSCRLTAGETADTDWVNNWKEFFKPFTVDDILICPTWEEVPEEHRDKMRIRIDPGAAFGTGTHETTQLCIRQIRKYMKPGARVLDVGTGSGILGITALKLGASYVFGTDLDDCAVTAARENAEINEITADQFEICKGNILEERTVRDAAGYECYDLVTANILAPVIILLQGEAARHMKPGAVIVTSGILNTKEAEVCKAFEENPEFEIIDRAAQGEWVSVIARKTRNGI